MARVKSNDLIEGLSGRIGKLIYKKYASGTIATSRPDRSKVKLSVKQKNANKKFKAAVAFAKGILADPNKRKTYEKNLKPGKSVYHTALVTFLNKDKA